MSVGVGVSSGTVESNSMQACLWPARELATGRVRHMKEVFARIQRLSVEDYVRAFETLRPDTLEPVLRMLNYHYRAAGQDVTPKDLSRVSDYPPSAVNLHYGKFAGRMADLLGIETDELALLDVLVHMRERDGVWHWVLRQPVSYALERLNWSD